MSTANILEIVDYSEKAIAVFGYGGSSNTKNYTTVLTEAGAKANPSLKYSDDKRCFGWIFSKNAIIKVQKLVDDINSGKIPPNTSENKKSESSSGTQYLNKQNNNQYVDIKAFMACMSRVEQLEQELALLKKHIGFETEKVAVKKITKQETVINYDDEEEEDDEIPPPRLLSTKKINK
jgi:hypothetical protein